MLIKPSPQVEDLSLAEIRAQVERNKTAEQDSLRDRQEAARAHQAQRAADAAVVRSLAAELATDVGVDPGALVTRLAALAPARHGPAADRTMGRPNSRPHSRAHGIISRRWRPTHAKGSRSTSSLSVRNCQPRRQLARSLKRA